MRILAGVLLIVAGLVALFAIIVIPVLPPTQNNASIDNFLAALVCKPNEKLVREQYQRSDSRGTSYSMTPYCVNSERQREDVTAKWALMGMGGFLVPFFIGLGLLIWGLTRAAKRRIETQMGSAFGDTGFTVMDARGTIQKQISFQDGGLKINGIDIQLDSLTPEKIEALKQQLRSVTGQGDLASKLKQIQDAKDQGLISSDEYDRLRQHILDDMS